VATLSERELVCAEVLVTEAGRSVRAVASDLGVDESTLRYRLKRPRATRPCSTRHR
jgi:transposase-like protein